jgi:DNA-binding PadR family transcriptional regulator
MSLKHGILGLLNYGPLSGYDLTKAFSQSLNFFWSAQTSQIYRELEAMAASGWIEVEEERQRGRMVATVYALAAPGREELARWLRESLEERERNRNPFLLRLFFQSSAGLESVRVLVGAFKERAEARAEALRETLEKVIPERRKAAENELTAFCWSQAAEYDLAQYEAEARWAEAFLARLVALEGERA